MGTSSPFEAGIMGGASVPDHLESLCAGDSDTVPNVISLDQIISDRSSAHDGLGVVSPTRHSDVDAAFDIGTKSRNGVVMDTCFRIVSVPRLDVDQVNTWWMYKRWRFWSVGFGIDLEVPEITDHP